MIGPASSGSAGPTIVRGGAGCDRLSRRATVRACLVEIPLAIKIAATGGAKPACAGWNSVGEGRLRILHRRGLNRQRISKQPLRTHDEHRAAGDSNRGNGRRKTRLRGFEFSRRRPTSHPASARFEPPANCQSLGRSPWRFKSRQRAARNPPARVRIQSAEAGFDPPGDSNRGNGRCETRLRGLEFSRRRLASIPVAIQIAATGGAKPACAG